MNHARDAFFTGAALALEQHGHIRGRRAVQRNRQLLEPRILADDLGRAAARGELFLEQQILGQGVSNFGSYYMGQP